MNGDNSSATRRLNTLLRHLSPPVSGQQATPQTHTRYQIGFIANPSTQGLHYTPPQITKTLAGLENPDARNGVGRQVGYGANTLERMGRQYGAGSVNNPYYAISRVYGGHTSMHSQIDQTRAQETRSAAHLSVGFNPQNTRAGFDISRGADSVPGAWHNDTGMHADPAALQATVPVGPGLHSGFRSMQLGMLHGQANRPKSQCSWSPNATSPTPEAKRKHNCITLGSEVVDQFAKSALNHIAVMEQLQGSVSPNQTNERTSLSQLRTITGNMRQIAEGARQDKVGNQGRTMSAMMSGGLYVPPGLPKAKL